MCVPLMYQMFLQTFRWNSNEGVLEKRASTYIYCKFSHKLLLCGRFLINKDLFLNGSLRNTML